MRKKSRLTKIQLILLIVCSILLLAAVSCFFMWKHLAALLPSQREAERWQGESDTAFKQISCFLPRDEQITMEEIGTFRRAAMTKLKDASQDVTGEEILMLDCWSTSAKVKAIGKHGKGDASVIAVGGNYFDFHPITLLSGDYLHAQDLMEDRVLLDEELSWLLFGGTDLTGMQVKLEGVPFTVAGVVRRETDFASKEAYTGGMGLYMSYEGLRKLNEEAKVDCYEYVLADPVKDFAINVAREKFPIGRGVILCNTTRYQYGKLMDILLKFGSRSAQTTGVMFPYWENAARITEDWAALCCLMITVLPIFPAVVGSVWLIRRIRRGKIKMEEEILPEVKERTEEAIRVRQRRRWERKHGLHEK